MFVVPLLPVTSDMGLVTMLLALVVPIVVIAAMLAVLVEHRLVGRERGALLEVGRQRRVGEAPTRRKLGLRLFWLARALNR